MAFALSLSKGGAWNRDLQEASLICRVILRKNQKGKWYWAAGAQSNQDPFRGTVENVLHRRSSRRKKHPWFLAFLCRMNGWWACFSFQVCGRLGWLWPFKSFLGPALSAVHVGFEAESLKTLGSLIRWSVKAGWQLSSKGSISLHLPSTEITSSSCIPSHPDYFCIKKFLINWICSFFDNFTYVHKCTLTSLSRPISLILTVSSTFPTNLLLTFISVCFLLYPLNLTRTVGVN